MKKYQVFVSASLLFFCVAACGDDDDDDDGGARDPSPGGGPPGPPGAAPSLPEQKGGSRLGGEYLVLDDGSRVLESWTDRQLGIRCTFVRTDASTWRCLPDSGYAFVDEERPESYVDAACTRPLYTTPKRLFPGPYSRPPDRAPALIEDPAQKEEREKRACDHEQEPSASYYSRAVEVGPGPSLFVRTIDQCGAGPNTFLDFEDQWYAAPGEAVPNAAFVGAKAEFGDGDAVGTLVAEDGARQWVAFFETCGRGTLPPSSSVTSVDVGTGRVRARVLRPSLRVIQLFDAELGIACKATAEGTTGRVRCLPNYTIPNTPPVPVETLPVLQRVRDP
jgi:hypothetical protein